MVVTSRPRFLCVVIRNRGTFGFHRGGAKSRKFGLFFEGTLRGLRLVDLFVLFAVGLVLKAEQGIQARKEFLK